MSTYQSDLVLPLEPRVLRLDEDGRSRWVARLSIDEHELGLRYKYLKALEKAYWNHYFVIEPLIVSDGYLLAGYSNERSGLGRWYCLNLENGEINWRTKILPIHHAATVGPGRFLIGAQGYGAFDTFLYDATKGLVREWNTHGYWVVRENSEVRLVEMENQLPSRMHVSVLEREGSVRKGPHLDGYHTTYPLLTSDGQLVFWRNGELCVVDETLERHVLHREPLIEGGGLRMLREPGGKLVFTLQRELWLVETELAEMAQSPWPCGSGNPGGNPVWQG